MLDDRAAHGDWSGALATVELNVSAKLLEKPTANRWRAVLKTAIALDRANRDPKGALALAQEACALAPGLIPAAALNGWLTAAAAIIAWAAKILEAAYRQSRIRNWLPSICACGPAISRCIVWPARGLWPGLRRSTSRAN